MRRSWPGLIGIGAIIFFKDLKEGDRFTFLEKHRPPEGLIAGGYPGTCGPFYKTGPNQFKQARTAACLFLSNHTFEALQMERVVLWQ